MQTKTKPPSLENIGQATVDQLNRWDALKIDHAGRLIRGRLDNGFLKANYSTRGGYYVTAIFDQYGEQLERGYYKTWDGEEPTGLILKVLKPTK